MQHIGVDVESRLIVPGNEAPILICGSWEMGRGDRFLSADKGVDTAPGYIRRYASWLHQPDLTLVAHSHTFDSTTILEAATMFYGREYGLSFAKLLWQAYKEGRVTCTALRQKIADNAAGRLARPGTKADLPSQAHLPHKKKSGYYSLAGCIWRHFKIDRGADKVEDAVRFRYYEVEGLPVNEWGADFERYSLQDSTDAINLYNIQESKYAASGCFRIEAQRNRASLTLRLASIWGVRTNAERVETLNDYCTRVVDAVDSKLVAAGLMREDWKKGQCHYVLTQAKAREWVAHAYHAKGLEIPHSKPSGKFPKTPENPQGGQVKLDSDTLEAIPQMYDGEEHPYGVLLDLAKSSLARGIKSKYVPAMRKGTIVPLHVFYQDFLETGRISASDQIQTPPRNTLDCFDCGLDARKVPAGADSCPNCGGYIGDVRSCYEARPGYVYGFVDYPQQEMCTLAQTQHDLIGSSLMGEAINKRQDLHCVFGADLMGGGITYEDFNARKKTDKAVKSWRQRAKGVNFAQMGKQGARGMQIYLKGYGVFLTIPQCKALIAKWKQRWADMPAYFRVIEGMGFKGFGSTATITHPRTGLIRGNVELPAACNMMFQTPAAFGSLDAGFHVAEEMYTVPSSPLYGSRLAFFLHDEWGAELLETRAPEAGLRMGVIMQSIMQRWTPDVLIKECLPVLSRRWHKGAEEVTDPVTGLPAIWSPSK